VKLPRFWPSPATTPESRKEFTEIDSGYYVVNALKARGVPYRYAVRDEITRPAFLDRTIITFHLRDITYFYDNHSRLGWADPEDKLVPGPIIDAPAAHQITQKGLTNAVLTQHGIRVPVGTTLPSRAKRQAALLFSALSQKAPLGLCVKPNSSSRACGVQVGLASLGEFEAAFEKTAKRHPHILVEETVPGTIYRLLCLAGRVIGIHFGVPANVLGDGVHSIAELVANKNANREFCPISIGGHAQWVLKKAGFNLEDVPPRGTFVALGQTSNFNRGADIIAATEHDLHESYITLAEKALSAFPGLFFCGVDMAIEDPAQPACDNYHVLELNCCPGLSAHYLPSVGEAQPVAEMLIDYLASNEPKQVARAQ
jgi:D-alanine-D-alanine ligase-like ATP-grasp enzyme